MADAAAAATVVEVYKDGKSLLTYFNRKIDYAKNLENNYKKMKAEVEKLDARRDDYKKKAKRDQGKELIKECEVWIEAVAQIKEEVQELESNYTKETSPRQEWYRGWPHAKLSKKLAAMTQNIQRTLESGKFETGILVEKLPGPVKKRYNIEANTSQHKVVVEILGSLKDRDVKKIGLWGLPGIGKTTILQNLNNKNMKEMFDIVIWVTVSENWSIKDVQYAIANQLGLNTKACTEVETADKISEELENKKYLLLLDEVWHDLGLDAIGIRDNLKDSKIVFTSRYRHICHDMEADWQIHVKELTSVDAWELFSAKVGPKVNLPSIKPIAELVVIECAGIPLIIDRVAKAFRRKEDSVQLWGDGLKDLRILASIEDQGMNEVLKVLEYCYEDLDGEDKKNCFLYSALYPEDCEIYIDYLLECWNAEGFIPDVMRLTGARNMMRLFWVMRLKDACNVMRLKDARNKGHTILNDLINVSLVERSDNKTHIKINKVLRTMALRISSKKKKFNSIVRASEGLKEWKQANRIFLMDNKLCKLPKPPNCKSLVTLFLQRNPSLEVIPKNFFQTMRNLRILDLHGTGIKSLPRTISKLICLKALYLNSCNNLTKFPSIKKGHLHLEVLDIRGTGINNIPTVVGTFSQLKCLRMSFSNSVVGHPNQGQLQTPNINRNVISRLLLLEELSIDVDPHNHQWGAVVQAIISEVARLENLVSLSFCFPRVECLQTFITECLLWKDLHFMFHVGYHKSKRYQVLEYFDNQIYKCLKFANGEGVDHAISEVLTVTDAFELINHKAVLSLSDFGIQSMNTMRGCLIESCTKIETIINVRTATEGVLIFLEKLYIKNVPKLVSIWEGPVHVGSLAMLTTLSLLGCASLKNIFSNGMIQQLSQLQQLRVEECPEIEELIMVSENGALLPYSLPKLKILVILDLPKLTSIWAGAQSLDWPSLGRIQIFSCHLLKRLPFHNANATRLISIEAQQAWWSLLEWKDQSDEPRLRSISTLT